LLKIVKMYNIMPQTTTKNVKISTAISHFGMGTLHRKPQLRPYGWMKKKNSSEGSCNARRGRYYPRQPVVAQDLRCEEP